jgi:hypothetical protein
MIISIKKGDQFTCIMEVVMDSGQTAYIEGKTYTCQGWARNGIEEGFNFPSELYSTHTWPIDKDFYRYFVPKSENQGHDSDTAQELHKEDLQGKEAEATAAQSARLSVDLPPYYDNSKGSLYKIASQRNWNPYLFDLVKRLERGGKKDPLDQEIRKSIGVLQLWLKEMEG